MNSLSFGRFTLTNSLRLVVPPDVTTPTAPRSHVDEPAPSNAPLAAETKVRALHRAVVQPRGTEQSQLRLAAPKPVNPDQPHLSTKAAIRRRHGLAPSARVVGTALAPLLDRCGNSTIEACEAAPIREAVRR